MMETFLGELIPPSLSNLWAWTETVCSEASSRGAPFKKRHADKARLHTWLAFQDPPGRQMHNAVLEHIMQPDNQYVRPFVAWFRDLFEL